MPDPTDKTPSEPERALLLRASRSRQKCIRATRAQMSDVMHLEALGLLVWADLRVYCITDAGEAALKDTDHD